MNTGKGTTFRLSPTCVCLLDTIASRNGWHRYQVVEQLAEHFNNIPLTGSPEDQTYKEKMGLLYGRKGEAYARPSTNTSSTF